MKAIRTRYIGPTDTKGSRVRADEPDGKSVTLQWDDSLNSDDNHRQAAEALRDRLGWKGELVEGSFGRYSFFVFR